MLGLTEDELLKAIDNAVLSTPQKAVFIKDQQGLQPSDILQRLTNSIARAIVTNNQIIEQQLRNAGIRI
jgi:hypothetical protein